MAKKVIDWESVEREYRAGIRSLRDIGVEFGCSHVAIKKRADKEEWPRDLAAKIEASAQAKVSKAVVTKTITTETLATERAIVEANAQVIADAVINQRRDVSRARSIVQKLFGEMDATIDGMEELRQLAELMASPDEKGVDKLNELYNKVISLPSRVDSTKKLAESLRVLVELERKVLRIKDDSSIEDVAKKFGDGVALSAMEAYSRMCNDASAS